MTLFYWNGDFSFAFNIFANVLFVLGLVNLMVWTVLAVRQIYYKLWR